MSSPGLGGSDDHPCLTCRGHLDGTCGTSLSVLHRSRELEDLTKAPPLGRVVMCGRADARG